jgi:5-amino-6-(5-phospho-D-ribitylamino)uracil phosphatase
MPVLEELELETRTVIFNGAAVYCPVEGRLVEERTFSSRTLAALHDHSARTGDLTVIMTSDRKLVRASVSAGDRRALEGLAGVEFVDPEHTDLRSIQHVIRVTFISDRTGDSAVLAQEVEVAVDKPIYLTHFPLSVLPRHRESRHFAVDVHPPCAGKAEALRVLEQTYGIPAHRVVAVGDATNDLPMIREAGLGVAMGSGMAELRAVADRVIGHHDGPALSQLIDELFL